jgi:hypothetical protein
VCSPRARRVPAFGSSSRLLRRAGRRVAAHRRAHRGRSLPRRPRVDRSCQCGLSQERQVVVDGDRDGPAAEAVQPAQQPPRFDGVVGIPVVDSRRSLLARLSAPTRSPPGRSTRTTSSSRRCCPSTVGTWCSIMNVAAEAVLLDLLEPVAAVTSVHAPIPDDECAARVARALLDNPPFAAWPPHSSARERPQRRPRADRPTPARPR